jgi:hypothetical protein
MEVSERSWLFCYDAAAPKSSRVPYIRHNYKALDAFKRCCDATTVRAQFGSKIDDESGCTEQEARDRVGMFSFSFYLFLFLLILF